MYLLMAIIAVVVSFSVAGAWFIDRDTVDSTMDMGGAVIVKLVGTGEDGTIQNFKQLYDSDGGAYPGDKILDSIKVQMGEKTEESVLRVQYSVDILDKEKNVKTQDLTEAETKLATLLKNDLRAKTTLFSSDWSQTTSDWIYYKHLASGKTKPIDLFDEYSLPLPDSEMDNQYQELSFRISLVAEAIQAANIMSHNEWNDDITNLSDSALMENVIKYNGERFAEIDEVLPYIETTGGQYIDTLYHTNINTAIEVSFQTKATGQWLFGTRISYGTNDTFAAYIGGTTMIWCQLANDSSSTQFKTPNFSDKQSVLVMNKDNAKLNGQQIGTFNITAMQESKYPAYIGTTNHGGAGESRYFVGKIFGARIWDNGELVRFFVPARDKDGNVGFYDLVTHQMFLNAGTGNFAYGHSINYIANGGTIAANAPKTFVSGDLPITLPTPTRAGYEFGGWFLSSDFSGAAQTTIPAGTDSNVYVYAKWIKTYNITYHLGGGINAEDNPTEFNERTLPLTLKAPTRDGFTFGDWYQNPAYSGNQMTTIDAGTEKNVSLWAKWNAIEYSVSYVLNGGTNSDQNVAKYSILDTSVKLYNPTYEGFVFEGWFTKSDFSGERMTYLSKDNLGDITLYAKWSQAYTITYNTNGGFNDGRNPSVFTENTETFTLFEAEKVNYSFLGWFDNEELTGTPITQIAKGTKNNIVLWAKWSSTQITVTFNPNGGGVSPLTKVVKKGGTYGELPTPTRAGYTFNGWVGKNLFDKTATAYKNGPYLRGSDGEEIPYGAYSIYQIQVPSGATLTITNSGQSQAPGYAFYTALGTYITGADYERKAVITTTVPANATYIRVSVNFGEEYRKDIDYFQVEIGSTQTAYENYKIITPSTNITLTQNHALCAIWTENVYTVTYNLDGGTNAAGNPATFKRSNLPVLLYDATKNGEYFAGWYLDAEFTKRVTKIDAGSLKNIELWARFSQSPLVFDLVGSSAYSVRAANTSISGNIEIPQTYNGKPVVVIQNSAFKDCSNVTSVLIPNSIKSIGINAFENCSNITETTIPEGVTLIGNNTFLGCEKLASVTLPTSLENIGANAFAGCTSLTSIVLPKNIQEIGANAFANCTKLATIEVFGDTPATLKTGVFPSSVSKIYVKPSLVSTYKAAWAEYKDKIVGFTEYSITYNLNGGTNDNRNITSFTKIDVPIKLYDPTKENADFLGWYATSDFSGEKVTEITTVSNVTLYARWDLKMTITYVLNGGTNSAANLSTITESMLPYSLGDPLSYDMLFEGWYYEAEFKNLANKIETFGDVTVYAKWGQGSIEVLEFVKLDNGNYSVKAKSGATLSGTIKIPAKYEGMIVEKIADSGFYNLTDITGIVLCSNITEIGSSAFYGCSNLVSVKLSTKLTIIGSQAFSGCSSLASIYIPSSVNSIGNDAFRYCSNLSRVEITNLSSWYKIVFSNDYSNPLSNTNAYMYLNDKKTLSVKIPVAITELKPYSCYGFNYVFIPQNITTIKEGKLFTTNDTIEIYCENESKPSGWTYNWNDGISTIWGVSGLPVETSEWRYVEKINGSILIIKYLGLDIEVAIPSTLDGKSVNEIYKECFSGKPTITSITIPSSVTSIGYNAFNGCSGFTKVNISDLASWFRITFGNGNSNPLNYAHHLYLNGTELTEITIPSSITKINDCALYGASSITRIYIPGGVTTISASSSSNSPFYGWNSSAVIYCGASSKPSGWGNYWNYYGSGSLSVVWGAKDFPQQNTDWIYAERTNGGIMLIKYLGGATEVAVPSTLSSKTVDEIYDNCFKDNASITSITIPNSITSIGYNAFNGCSGLTKVNISDLASWFKILFGNEYSNPLYYTHHLYLNGTELTEITVPNTITKINEYALYGASAITRIYIPGGVTTISPSSSSNSPFYGWNSSAVIYCGASSKPSGWKNYWNYYGSGSLSVVWGAKDFPQQNTDWIYAEKTNGSIMLIKYLGSATEVEVPSTLSSKTVSEICGDCFASNSAITSITIPSGVTSIGSSAFSGCSNLSKVNISDIASWFKILFGNEYSNPLYYTHHLYLNGTELTEITVPNTITKINEYALYGASAITSITIPSGVTSIGGSAFRDCNVLATLTIPFVGGSLTSNNYLGYIFGATSSSNNSSYVPSSLKTVVVTGGTSIAGSAFKGCSGLTSITIPSSVTSIGYNAFDGCSGLISITIPSGVTSIGSSAFYDCSGLTSIKIPEGVMIIDWSTFNGCSGLISINIPSSVTRIGYGAFRRCSGLTKVDITNLEAWFNITFEDSEANPLYYAHHLYLNNKELTEITIPSSITKINNCALYGASSITSITIPSGVTGIGMYAFYNCSGLTSINIPDGVTSIGYAAFSGCSGLTSINIPYGVTSIEGSTFSGCSGLTSITIPSSVTSIGSNAFSGCSGLTSINIPDGVTSIEDRTFDGCSSLTSITIPDGVTSIGYSAFQNCSGLISVIIPNSVTSISSYAFSGCGGLTSITLSNKLTNIRNNTFENCTSMKRIYIPSSVTTIYGSSYSYSPFYGCNSLAVIYCEAESKPSDWGTYWNYYDSSNQLTAIWNMTGFGSKTSDWEYVVENGSVSIIRYIGTMAIVNIPSTLENKSVTKIYDKCFQNNTTITSVTIPDGVTSIGYAAFSGCSGLTSINIPYGVTSIEGSTFSGCSGLTSITIPNSVTSIGGSAFSGCTAMRRIYIPSSVTTISASSYSNSPFYGWNSTAIIYCGASSEPSGWGSYWNSYGYSSRLKVVLNVVGIQQNSEWEYVEKNDGTIGVLKYLGSAVEVAVPSTLSSKTVVEIYENCFRNNSTVTNITIPNSVTSMGSSAFAGCNALATLTIPYVGRTSTSNNYLGYIFGASSYSSNSTSVPGSLKTIVVTGGTSIASYAFYGCSSLTSITIPNSVTSMGSSAFSGCSGLTSITIPFVGGSSSSNTYLGFIFGASSYSSNSNYVPSSLKTVIVTGGTSIASYAFYNCSSLTSINIPDGVTSIGSFAFNGCSGLTSITLPSSVTSIGINAFKNCTSMRRIYIPNSVTTISASSYSNSPFYGWNSTAIIYCGASSKLSGWGAYWNYYSSSGILSVVWGASGLPES